MTDDDESYGLLTPVLTAASGLFAAAGAARRGLYSARLLKAGRVDVPVISVGNVAVGGSGKTPFTKLLADRLADRRVAIVTRGYGRRDKSRQVVVVSEGAGPQVAVEEAGDEPYWLAENTKARVIVSADRVLGARHTILTHDTEVVILDDGFQHLAIHRDLDLVLVDAREPFGNGRLLPRGPLREPPSALNRADLVVLNHGEALHDAIDPRLADHRCVDVVVRAEASAPIDDRAVALLTGIARPERVERTVTGLGGRIVHSQAFSDHAWFTEADVDGFAQQARRAGAELLLTTEKDAVRLPAAQRESFESVRIRHEIVRGESDLAQALARALKQDS